MDLRLQVSWETKSKLPPESSPHHRWIRHKYNPRPTTQKTRVNQNPAQPMRHTCAPPNHNNPAYEDRDPNAVTQESIQVMQKTVLAPQPAQSPETASYAVAFGAFNAFAVHYEPTTGELCQQNQDIKLGPGHPQSYPPWAYPSSPSSQAQQQHIHQDPHAAHGVRPLPGHLERNLPRPSATQLVALQLHEETYT